MYSEGWRTGGKRTGKVQRRLIRMAERQTDHPGGFQGGHKASAFGCSAVSRPLHYHVLGHTPFLQLGSKEKGCSKGTQALLLSSKQTTSINFPPALLCVVSKAQTYQHIIYFQVFKRFQLNVLTYSAHYFSLLSIVKGTLIDIGFIFMICLLSNSLKRSGSLP